MLKIITLLIIANITLFANIKQDTIKTTAVCDECKERIEKKLKQVRLIDEYNLEFSSGNLYVKYSDEKITKDEIKRIVSSLGYDADEIKADAKAYAKLPKCCKHKEIK